MCVPNPNYMFIFLSGIATFEDVSASVANDEIILDVRNPDEVEENGMITGAMGIPCKMILDPSNSMLIRICSCPLWHIHILLIQGAYLMMNMFPCINYGSRPAVVYSTWEMQFSLLQRPRFCVSDGTQLQSVVVCETNYIYKTKSNPST